MDSVVHANVTNTKPNSTQTKLNDRDVSLPISPNLLENKISHQYSYWGLNRTSLVTEESKVNQNNQVSTWIHNKVSPEVLIPPMNGTNQYSIWKINENTSILTTRSNVKIENEVNTASTK